MKLTKTAVVPYQLNLSQNSTKVMVKACHPILPLTLRKVFISSIVGSELVEPLPMLASSPALFAARCASPACALILGRWASATAVAKSGLSTPGMVVISRENDT